MAADPTTTTGATRIAEVAAARAVEASREKASPSPLVIGVICALLGIVPAGIGGLISYGNLSARLDALEQRMDRTDAAAEKSLGKIETRLDSMANKLESIQSSVGRIEARTEERRR